MSAFVFISTNRAIVSQLAAADSNRTQAITLVVADGQGDATIDGVAVLDLGSVGRSKLLRTLEKSVVARTLRRLSPGDDGARIARRMRRNTRAAAAARAADVVIACDRDCILAAWESTTGAGTGALGLAQLAGGLATLRRASGQ
jgi:hypothetical protein